MSSVLCVHSDGELFGTRVKGLRKKIAEALAASGLESKFQNYFPTRWEQFHRGAIVLVRQKNGLPQYPGARTRVDNDIPRTVEIGLPCFVYCLGRGMNVYRATSKVRADLGSATENRLLFLEMQSRIQLAETASFKEFLATCSAK